MLEILEKLANKLQPFRKVSFIAAVLLLSGIVIQLMLFPTQQLVNSYTIIFFIAFIWFLLFHILLTIFHDIPSSGQADSSVLERFKIKFQRFLYHFIAFLFICLTAVIVFLSVRLLRV